MTAQEKLKAAIKQQKRRLQAEFYQAVQAELKRAIDETVLPQYLKEMKGARQITESRKGIVKRETYRLILACLHPDQVTDPEKKERYTKAFHAFSDLALLLCDEKQMTTAPTAPMPRSYEEMMRMRADAAAAVIQWCAAEVVLTCVILRTWGRFAPGFFMSVIG